ncbi:MAG: ATP-binding protein [Planctomycetota bacterium]|nr:ATP-binding protein [Planctomycetota bacterium]
MVNLLVLGTLLGANFSVVQGLFTKAATTVYSAFLASVGVALMFGAIGLVATRTETAITTSAVVFSAFLFGALRAYYYLFHLLFVALRGDHYRVHPVAWDDMCSLPFPGLARLLVAYAEASPVEGEQELNRLSEKYPSQQPSALWARTILVARQCGRRSRLTEVPELAARLPEGDRGYLAETRRLREMIDEIARLQARLDTVTRPFFREPLARSLVAEINAFQGTIAGFHEPLASEFRKASQAWLALAQRQWDEARTVLAKSRTPQVFRAGDPVDRSQEAFVERNEVVGEVEGQIMLSTGCAGLILYGRRRVGKSTVLKNLPAFLPNHVRVATLSMQNAEAFTSLASLLRLIAKTVQAACHDLELPTIEAAGLADLFPWLGRVNERLKQHSARLLLAVDEYESLDLKIGSGTFPEDLLAALRDSIQSHRQITWVLAGSHDITELVHAPWPSYLVSMRTIDVPLFTPEETRLLLTAPLRHSQLWPANDPQRPRFEPGFWGEGGVERIHAEAAGWPHLVQLIAETAVDVVNNSAATQLDASLFDATLDKAVARGDAVLRLLMQTESTLVGEWDYLCGFRRRDLQPPPADEALYTSFRRRLLVVDEVGQWRLRVPLMQRWLRQRG